MSNQQHLRFRFLRLLRFAAGLAALLLPCLCASLAQSDGNRVVVPLSDPSRPAMVRTHLLNGSITVKGYEGKDVIVETNGHRHEHSEANENSGGLRRIPQAASGLSIDSENNEVNIKLDVLHQDAGFTITVPRRTSLSLSTVNGSEIVVSDVEGELDVNSTNGSVTLNNVSGSAVVHALNGRIVATFTRVDSQKPMAFSSLNGNIDVTLPPDVKANVSLRTDNGEIYSDFDIKVQFSGPLLEENDGHKGGKYRVKGDKTLHGTLNGGGPEIQIKDFNGSVYLRKGK